MKSKEYLKEIMGRDIEWFDYVSLDKARQLEYYTDAQQIVKNEVFLNELKKYTADLIKFCAMDAGTLEQLTNVRTAIITLETFKQRLEEIQDPRERNVVKDPNAAI